jgi:Flp pilus assembly pilin Flp
MLEPEHRKRSMRSMLHRLLRTHFRKFLADESAPSAIEYAMLVAGVGVILLALVYSLGTGKRSALEHTSPIAPASTSPLTP